MTGIDGPSNGVDTSCANRECQRHFSELDIVIWTGSRYQRLLSLRVIRLTEASIMLVLLSKT